jgi:hypothetical protein
LVVDAVSVDSCLPLSESGLFFCGSPQVDGVVSVPRCLSRCAAGARRAGAIQVSDFVEWFSENARAINGFARHLGVPTSAMAFVSSNFWDVEGAKKLRVLDMLGEPVQLS